MAEFFRTTHDGRPIELIVMRAADGEILTSPARDIIDGRNPNLERDFFRLLDRVRRRDQKIARLAGEQLAHLIGARPARAEA